MMSIFAATGVDYRILVYTLAFLALAGCALWQTARSSARGGRIGLRMAAAGLLVEGLATAALVPAQATRAAEWLHHAGLFGTVGRPIDLVRGLCGLAIVAGLAISWRSRGSQASSSLLRRAVFPAACLLLIVLGWTAVRPSENSAPATLWMVAGESQSALPVESGQAVLIECEPQPVSSDPVAWDRVASQRQRKGAAFLGCVAVAVVVLIAIERWQVARHRSASPRRPARI